MSVDLSKVLLDSNTPAFRNLADGTGTINFSGTLTVPGGSTPTSLSKSTTITVVENPALVNIFMSQDQVSTSGSFQNAYAANEEIQVPPYNSVIIPASSPAGLGGWATDVSVKINGTDITITLTAYNAGGIGSDVVFVPTTFSIRCVPYLPTQ